MTESLRGQLLLDGGSLQGSFFHRTVVLICRHDPDGAFGLVLNRKLDRSVGELVSVPLPGALSDAPLFVGGPVQPSALSYLHSNAFLPDANVMADLEVGHSLEGLIQVGESLSMKARFRVFGGYAGWSPGQLDDEMRRGAWLLHPASLELIFHEEPQNLWRIILSQKDWKCRLLSASPEDLSWN